MTGPAVSFTRHLASSCAQAHRFGFAEPTRDVVGSYDPTHHERHVDVHQL
ncbi:MAG TPA: hypothetical protein VIU87_26380 [Mycobacterium sp.]